MAIPLDPKQLVSAEELLMSQVVSQEATSMSHRESLTNIKHGGIK